MTDVVALAAEAVGVEQYALAVEAAGDGVFDWDLVANTLVLSAGWRAQLGLRPGRDLGATPSAWLDRVDPADREDLEDAIQAHLADETAALHAEYRVRHKDGSTKHMLARGRAIRDEHGRAVRLIGTQTDVSAYKVAEARLQHDALHDPLTGLPNRSLFLDRLELALRRARRQPGRPACAVLFIDLDRFKLVNDSLGHLAGDRLLQVVADRLAQAVRPGDTVARMGGDEFTVLLESLADAGEARAVAGRVREALAVPVNIDTHELRVSASIGIATAGPGASAHDVLRDADVAMYRVKDHVA